MNRIACVLVMSLLLWPACNTQQNAASETQQRLDVAKQKEMYQERVEENLRKLDREIDALKAKMRNESKVDGKALDREMAELEQKREAAHQKFERLKDSSQAAWQDMRAGIDAAMDDLSAAYEKASSHIK
jgi:predicted RNase H-like nuclease (RuvC/YqgF family)